LLKSGSHAGKTKSKPEYQGTRKREKAEKNFLEKDLKEKGGGDILKSNLSSELGSIDLIEL